MKLFKVNSSDANKNGEFVLVAACEKFSLNQNNAGSIGIIFSYDRRGLSYRIQLLSSGDESTFSTAFLETKKREELIKRARLKYEGLITMKEKLGLPGEVKKM